MKTHTSQFKDKIKLLGRELDNIITFENNGEEIELGNEDLNSITPHYEGAILKSIMRQLDIDSNVDIPKDTIINYQFGIKINDSYEYLDMGNYIVYSSEKQEDTDSYKIICYDKMLYSMVDYVDMEITYPITIRNYINTIATHLGLTFKNANDTSFANWNKEIPNEKYLTSDGNSMGYKFRDILDELAQVTASTICINEADDELEIRYITNSLDTIDEEYLKDINVNFEEKYGPVNSIVLSRSAESDNVYQQDSQSIEENGLCEIKIVDNQIMNDNNRADYLPDILSKLDGLEYYLNDFSSTGIVYYNLCDKYNIKVGDITYPCVMLNDEINVSQGLEENIYTDMPEETVTDYSKADKTDMRINQTYLIVDKQNQTIESVVTNVGQQDEKISAISQTVDELNAKISDIANVTVTGESTEAYVQLDNINASEPIEIKIRPINSVNNISYLYPHSNIYPSGNLYSKTRTIRFTNTSTNETFDLVLPDDLLYYNSSNYDEFILDYENEIFRVNKKCKYNADGSVGLLSTPETNDYTYQHLSLSDGDYTISLLGYSSGYIYVRLMAANIYTTQFATRVEMTSAINQKADEINIVVAEKLDEDEFTHAQIVVKINDDTSQIKIEADKVDIKANDVLNILAGNTINLTSKGIVITSNNFNVDASGNLTCSNANISGVVNASSGTFNGTVNASGGSIGGFTLTGGKLYSGSGTSQAGMGVINNAYAFYAGNEDSGLAPFRVGHDGVLVASNANITGTITATSGSFTGTVHATSGSFTGSINATSGSFNGTIRASSGNIGGWTINSAGIQGTHGSYSVRLTPDGVGINRGPGWQFKPWDAV